MPANSLQILEMQNNEDAEAPEKEAADNFSDRFQDFLAQERGISKNENEDEDKALPIQEPINELKNIESMMSMAQSKPADTLRSAYL